MNLFLPGTAQDRDWFCRRLQAVELGSLSLDAVDLQVILDTWQTSPDREWFDDTALPIHAFSNGVLLAFKADSLMSVPCLLLQIIPL